MIYFPFDNSSPTVLDRNVSSDVFADYLKTFFRNGIHPEDSTYFQVYSEETPSVMEVKVKPGLALINGRFAREIVERTLTVQPSGALDRIDTVVLRLDLLNRNIDLYVVESTYGPLIIPAPIRVGDIYELIIATIDVQASSSTIPNIKITDRRLDSYFCGMIAGTVEEVDTTEIFNQYQAALDEFLAIVASAIDETMYGDLVNLIELRALEETYTATLPSASWTGASAPFSKVVTVTGMLSTDNPIIDIVQTGTYATDVTMQNNWAKIYRAVTSSNTVTFYAHSVPSADIPLQFKVVR